jgi:hypothetical protein
MAACDHNAIGARERVGGKIKNWSGYDTYIDNVATGRFDTCSNPFKRKGAWVSPFSAKYRGGIP